ncbi:hypothetical protein BJ944DRAFT_230228 [Cunninghamella echinulata]|nr:hypothetical protein BJ944DRAFT_230228 [Cunninghamella echinulata]
MKATLITLTSIAATLANAAIVIQEPWAKSSIWKSGQTATITWTFDPTDADKLCDIQMLGGEVKDANIVAHVTSPSKPVSCGAGRYEITPLNDFNKGQYWLRIGQESTNTWYYSGGFDFDGKGSVTPLKLADGTPLKPENPKDQPKDLTKEAPKDNNNNNNNNKDAPKDTPKDAPKDTTKDTPKDTTKDAPKDNNGAPKNGNGAQNPKASGSTGSSSSNASKASASASASASSSANGSTNNNNKTNPSSSTTNNNKVQDTKKTNAGYQISANQYLLAGVASMIGYAFVF